MGLLAFLTTRSLFACSFLRMGFVQESGLAEDGGPELMAKLKAQVCKGHEMQLGRALAPEPFMKALRAPTS